jgi:hypothetical protein
LWSSSTEGSNKCSRYSLLFDMSKLLPISLNHTPAIVEVFEREDSAGEGTPSHLFALGWNFCPHFGHSIRSKSTHLTRSGVIVNPHLGQVLSREARTFARSIFRGRDNGKINLTPRRIKSEPLCQRGCRSQGFPTAKTVLIESPVRYMITDLPNYTHCPRMIPVPGCISAVVHIRGTCSPLFSRALPIVAGLPDRLPKAMRCPKILPGTAAPAA